MRTETESVRRCMGTQSSAEKALIGKKVENKTCRLPDVSVKAVRAAAAAQVHKRGGVGGLHVHQREPSGSWTALLLDTWLPASLQTAVHPHMLHHVRLVPARSSCCMLSDFVYC